MRGDPSTAGPRGRPRTAGQRLAGLVERYARFVLIGPSAVFVVMMIIIPVAFTVWLSLHHWTGGAVGTPEFIGFANYRTLVQDDRFWSAMARSFGFSVVVVAAQTVLGVSLGLLLNREFLGKGFVRTLFLLPMIATPVAVALVWRLMFDPNLGVLNEILRAVGLPPSLWVASPALVLPSLALVDIWQWTPLIVLVTLTGLSVLPREPMEAALIDGASAWQRFWHVVLPLLRPVLAVAVVLRMIDALKTFDIIFVITEGGPGYASETLNLYVFRNSFLFFNLGYASALIVAFFTVVIGATLIVFKIGGER